MYVAFIDTLGIYPFEYLTFGYFTYTYSNWGCDGTAISGADAISLGDGLQNYLDVLADCPAPAFPDNNIFNQCSTTPPGFFGYHIASQDEAVLIYNEFLSVQTINIPNGSNFLWTSTEAAGANESTHAKAINHTDGTIVELPKSTVTRAITIKYH